MGVFSQYLSKEEQREFIEKADIFFAKKGINFIYPLHGGYMGQDAKILSYGISRVYNSLAPEFQTYETIKNLAENKSEEKPMIYIEKPRNALYIFDREIIPLDKVVIIGEITVIANAYDENGINKVEFYVNGVMKSTDYSEPYSWLWDEFAVGKHEIKVIAYDNNDKKAEDKINVIIFNF